MTAPAQSQKTEADSDKGFVVRAQQEQYSLIHLLPLILDQYHVKQSISYHADFCWPSETKDGNLDIFKSFSKKSALSTLNRLPPSILSSLVPVIRLYKTFYSPSGKPLFDWEIPFTDFTSPNDINDILQFRRGTMNGANIVDFNYNFIGTNPAEAESCLTAKLNLKFQSIDKFLTPIYISDIEPHEIVDSDTAPYVFKYSQLALQEERFKDNNFNPNYYTLKAVVGYNPSVDVIGAINDSIPDLTVEQIVSAIKSSVTLINLYPTVHEIAFEKNGTINFSVDFRGAIENAFSETYADVFLCSSKGKEFVNFLKTKKQESKARKEALEQIGKDPSRNCINTETAEYKAQKEKDDKAEEEAKVQIEQQRSEFFSSFYSDLLGQSYMLYLNSPNLQNILGTEVNAIFADQQEANEDLLAGIRNGLSEAQYAALATGLTVNKVDDARITELTNAATEKIRGANAADLTPKALQNADKDNLYFILLGDLINFVYKHFLYNTTALNYLSNEEIPVLILGNISILTPKQFGRVISSKGVSLTGDEIVNDGVSYNQFTIPISQLPISLNYFNKWYTEKVIKPKREKFPLQVFLNEIIELIRISTTLVYGSKYGTLVNSRTVGLGLSVEKSLTDQLRRPGFIEGSSGAYGSQKFSKFFQDNRGTGAFSFDSLKTNNSRSVYIIFVSTIPIQSIDPTNVISNENNKGIITYSIGSQTGILKDATFKKMNIQFQKESKMTLDGSLGSGVMRMKYNCALTMFGPSLYNPGDIVIVNPVFLSSGKNLTNGGTPFIGDINSGVQKMLISELGLGGIYVVNKVDTKIASGVCETSMDCVFLQYGAGTIDLPSGESVPLGTCPA